MIGEAAIDNATGTKTDYGFFIKSLPELEIPTDIRAGDELNDSTVRWEMKGKPYTASLKIYGGDKSRPLIPEGNSPKYS